MNRTFGQHFNLGRDSQKKFLWESRLWVCRRKETILSYVTRNYEKKRILFFTNKRILFISVSLLKKLKVSVSANIAENFKVPIPIPWKMADTIGASLAITPWSGNQYLSDCNSLLLLIIHPPGPQFQQTHLHGTAIRLCLAVCDVFALYGVLQEKNKIKI